MQTQEITNNENETRAKLYELTHRYAILSAEQRENKQERREADRANDFAASYKWNVNCDRTRMKLRGIHIALAFLKGRSFSQVEKYFYYKLPSDGIVEYEKKRRDQMAALKYAAKCVKASKDSEDRADFDAWVNQHQG